MSNFIVVPYTQSERGYSIVNEIGVYDGTATQQFNGVFWIAIDADGAWTLDLRPF